MSDPGTEPDDTDAAATDDSISTSAVNQQIMGAVQASTEFAFGLTTELNPVSGTTRMSAGVAIAYDKAAQAAALGVQDATDYERNVLSISSAAQGKALAMILAGTNVQDAAIGFVLALVASIVAPIVVAEVGIAQTTMLSKFPQA
ncbi:MAG: hypothetical protein ACREHE_07200 [Rhizomicrobium sp.]